MSTRTELYRRMYRTFRHIHRLNRYVDQEPQLSVTLLEVHVLTEIAADPTHQQRSMAALLQVQQSTLSRTLQRLSRRKLLKITKCPDDARSRLLTLTPQGMQGVRDSDKLTDDSFNAWSVRLTGRERTELESFYRALADGLGHPPGIPRPSEPPYRLQQRRITQSSGILSDNLFGSGYSGTGWQVLSALVEAESGRKPSELARDLLIAQDKVHRLLADFAKHRFVERTNSTGDQRETICQITGLGKDEGKKVELQGIAHFKRALNTVPQTRLRQWVEILERFAGYYEPHSVDVLPGASFDLMRTAAEKVLARAFTIDSLAGHREARFAPSVIAGDRDLVVQVRRGKQMLVTFCGTVDRRVFHISVIGRAKTVSNSTIASMLKAALPRYLSSCCGVDRIHIEFPPFADVRS